MLLNAERHGTWAVEPVVYQLDWNEPHQLQMYPECNLIVGSELCYAPHHQDLADVLLQLLPPSTQRPHSLSSAEEGTAIVLVRPCAVRPNPNSNPSLNLNLNPNPTWTQTESEHEPYHPNSIKP